MSARAHTLPLFVFCPLPAYPTRGESRCNRFSELNGSAPCGDMWQTRRRPLACERRGKPRCTGRIWRNGLTPRLHERVQERCLHHHGRVSDQRRSRRAQQGRQHQVVRLDPASDDYTYRKFFLDRDLRLETASACRFFEVPPFLIPFGYVV